MYGEGCEVKCVGGDGKANFMLPDSCNLGSHMRTFILFTVPSHCVHTSSL